MRYTCLTKQERKAMLKAIGIEHASQLYAKLSGLEYDNYNLPNFASEEEVTAHITALANKNTSTSNSPCFIGAGRYIHNIPSAVDALIQRGEFLTAYTPFQPEASQGTLQVIFEFQSIIARITGMEIANASMYDGQTSLAEAYLMASRISKKSQVCIVGSINPDYLSVLETYYAGVTGSQKIDQFESASQLQQSEKLESYACIIIQTPSYTGEIFNDYQALQKIKEQHKTLIVCCTSEILSWGMYAPPTIADIICGDASSLGAAVGLGGPGLGFFTTKKQYVRQMPGRLCGVTKDTKGKRGFVLTLNAREQHIRREKATSNICSNQGLLATAFTIHATLLGSTGFARLATLNHHLACTLAQGLQSTKKAVVKNSSFFNEFVYSVPSHKASTVLQKLEEAGIFGGVQIEGTEDILAAVTEHNTPQNITKYIEVISQL